MTPRWRYPLYPWARDWSQYYVYKWKLADFDWDNPSADADTGAFEGPHGLPDVEKTLEQFRRIDNVTRGIPKVAILISFQQYVRTEGGAAPWDCQWPSFSTVSAAFAKDTLDGARGVSSSEAIRWLMKKAREECNTLVTFHLDFNGAQPHSALWDDYLQKGLLCRDADGVLHADRYIGGQVNLQKDFKTGRFQQRINDFLRLFPEVLNTKLILNDWNWNCVSEYDGYTAGDSMAALRQCMAWLKDMYDIDVQGELVSHNPLKMEFDYGTQAMCTAYGRADSIVKPNPMEVPAYVFCGGEGGPADDMDAAEAPPDPGALRFSDATLLFGGTTAGEGGRRYTSIVNDKHNTYSNKIPVGLGDPASFRPNALFRDFAYCSLSWYYLNRLLRVDSDNSTFVRFSGGVRSEVVDGKVQISQNGNLLRDGNDLFVPELWKSTREIMAWSDDGYENRRWALPGGWEGVAAVDVYNNTLGGVTLRARNLPVTNGAISLILGEYDGCVIVPAGTTPIDHEPPKAGVSGKGTARFIGVDTATLGSEWRNHYGKDAVYIPASGKALPPGVTIEGAREEIAVAPGLPAEKSPIGKLDGLPLCRARLHQIVGVDCGRGTKYVTLYIYYPFDDKTAMIIEAIDAESNERSGAWRCLSAKETHKGVFVTFVVTGHIRLRLTKIHGPRYGSADEKISIANRASEAVFSALFIDMDVPMTIT